LRGLYLSAGLDHPAESDGFDRLNLQSGGFGLLFGEVDFVGVLFVSAVGICMVMAFVAVIVAFVVMIVGVMVVTVARCMFVSVSRCVLMPFVVAVATAGNKRHDNEETDCISFHICYLLN
jgi:uncharacterized membrane protein (UPF0182 family)